MTHLLGDRLREEAQCQSHFTEARGHQQSIVGAQSLKVLIIEALRRMPAEDRPNLVSPGAGAAYRLAALARTAVLSLQEDAHHVSPITQIGEVVFRLSHGGDPTELRGGAVKYFALVCEIAEEDEDWRCHAISAAS